MEDLMIRIDLDPVNDKIVNFPVRNNSGDGKDIKNVKALVIGTNGEYRTVDTDEMEKIMIALDTKSLAKSLSDDYVMMYSAGKTFYGVGV